MPAGGGSHATGSSPCPGRVRTRRRAGPLTNGGSMRGCQACQLVDENSVTRQVVCSSDVAPHLEAISSSWTPDTTTSTLHDHVYVNEVGPDQEGFFRFYETTVLPQLV